MNVWRAFRDWWYSVIRQPLKLLYRTFPDPDWPRSPSPLRRP